MIATMDTTSDWTAWPEAEALNLDAVNGVSGDEVRDRTNIPAVNTALDQAPAVSENGARPTPAIFAQRARPVRHNLDYLGLKRLMNEEEQLAFQSFTHGLTPAGQQRLTAIEAELDRRWALFG